MRTVRHIAPAGYTLVELVVVLGLLAILSAMGWPKTAELIERATLWAAAHTLLMDIRRVQAESRATGKRIGVLVDPAVGTYGVSVDGALRRSHRLPAGLAFGAPDNPASDGVTFRENTVWVTPRPGPQNSLGSISIRSSRGGARRVTVSLSGHTSIAVWDGRRWN